MLVRRNMLTLACASACSLAYRSAAAQQPPTAIPSMPGMASGGMTLEQCITDCLGSHRMCLATGQYCIERGGPHAAAAHLALLLDCAEMCQTTANSMLRHSSQHQALCAACAQICDACAESCEAFRADEVMARCAKTCRDCAGSCRMMSKQPI